MTRLLQIEKRIERLTDRHPETGAEEVTWVGSMYRPVTEFEDQTAAHYGTAGLVRVWASGGVGGRLYFDTLEEAQAWQAEPLECWVEPAKPDEVGWAEVSVHVRSPVRLFESLTDNELHVLSDILDWAKIENDMEITFPTIRRLAAAARTEDEARAERAKRLAPEQA